MKEPPALPHFTAEAVAALPGPAWLRDARREAWGRFSSTPMPTSALEEWRYSRIDQLDLERYHPSADDGAAPSVPSRVGELVASLEAVVVITVRNGRVAHVKGGDPAVTVDIAAAEPAPYGDIAGEPDALTALNAALATPIVLRVRPGARPAGPIVVVHELDGDGLAAFPRTVLRAGANSEVTLIELATSADVDALSVPVTELDVADGAQVRYLHVQSDGPAVWQSGLQASRVGRDATLISASVALGGDYARMRADSALVGSGGTTRLLAVYFATADRMIDFRTTQAHRAPKTTSELLFKGALANSSRAVYSGLIRVEKGARGTNAFQTNRNLVLHEGAHAESVPNLEIEDNDVHCSHASAVGPISEDQRFYLESRGVRPDVADRLITLGFLDEVLDRLPSPAVADAVRRALATMLDGAERIEVEAGHRVPAGTALNAEVAS